MFIRPALGICLSAVVLWPGCAQQTAEPSPASSTRRSPAGASTDRPIAQIDGQKIMRSDFIDLLIESHGLTVLQQMLLAALAREEAERAGITVTPADVDAEYTRQLSRLYPVTADPPSDDVRQQQQRALERVLQAQGLSQAEYKLKVERDAYVRALAQQRLEISPEDLQREYRMLYGPKVQLRMITCSTLRDAGYARQRIESGEDFATVAQQMTVNPAAAESGGLTAPFSLEDPALDPLLRSTVERLEPGQVSETIRVGPEYVIARLEQRTEPSGVAYEDVRDLVDRTCRERKLAELSDQITARLIRNARLVIYEPALRTQYNQRRAEFGGVAPALSGPSTQQPR